MACKHCDFKGFVEVARIGGGKPLQGFAGQEARGLAQCWHCRDDRRYTDAVREVLGYLPVERGPATILEFPTESLKNVPRRNALT